MPHRTVASNRPKGSARGIRASSSYTPRNTLVGSIRSKIYFSILQRKVLTPNDFTNIDEVAGCIDEFGRRYSALGKPFAWCFTRQELERRLRDPSIQPQLLMLASAA